VRAFGIVSARKLKDRPASTRLDAHNPATPRVSCHAGGCGQASIVATASVTSARGSPLKSYWCFCPPKGLPRSRPRGPNKALSARRVLRTNGLETRLGATTQCRAHVDRDRNGRRRGTEDVQRGEGSSGHNGIERASALSTGALAALRACDGLPSLHGCIDHCPVSVQLDQPAPVHGPQ
jgi:hypothetical protein